MSGYTNIAGFGGTPLGYNFPTTSTSPGGWGPGGGPAPAQIASYQPGSYADTMRWSTPSTPLSYGGGMLTGTGGSNGASGVGGGSGPQMDPSGMDVTSQPVTAKQLAGGADAPSDSKWTMGGALDGFKTLASVVGTFGQIYSGIQMNKIAKQQLAFSKESYAENLKNQKKAYNNSSEARSRSAGVQNNWSDSEVSAHIAKRAM